jgi:hypothetical protein
MVANERLSRQRKRKEKVMSSRYFKLVSDFYGVVLTVAVVVGSICRLYGDELPIHEQDSVALPDLRAKSAVALWLRSKSHAGRPRSGGTLSRWRR